MASRKCIAGYNYSLKFDDTANQYLNCPYHASYTDDIAGAFTVLIYAKLHTRSNTANDFHSLVSNNAAISVNNFYVIGTSDNQGVTAYIANGTTSDNISSDDKYTADAWNWFGESYATGVGFDVILNKTIKTKVPTITATMRSNSMLVGTSSNANLRINGYVAKFWIFGGRISQAELNRVVEDGVKPASLTPALIWDATEGSGGTLNDSSPNSNTGNFNNGVAWNTTELPSKLRTLV